MAMTAVPRQECYRAGLEADHIAGNSPVATAIGDGVALRA